MNIRILILVILIATPLFGQTKEETPTPKKINFGFGFNISGEFLDKTMAEEIGVASFGLTLIDMNGRAKFLKYVVVDAGFSVSQFKDKLPFTQAVVFTSGSLSGLPSNAKSKITSGSLYYSAGFMVPIVSKLHLNGSFGKRRYSASRGIPSCDDCNKTDLDMKAGNYLKTGFSWLQKKADGNPEGEFNLIYTHYLEDSPFQSTITLGLLVYF